MTFLTNWRPFYFQERVFRPKVKLKKIIYPRSWVFDICCFFIWPSRKRPTRHHFFYQIWGRTLNFLVVFRRRKNNLKKNIKRPFQRAALDHVLQGKTHYTIRFSLKRCFLIRENDSLQTIFEKTIYFLNHNLSVRLPKTTCDHEIIFIIIKQFVYPFSRLFHFLGLIKVFTLPYILR